MAQDAANTASEEEKVATEGDTEAQKTKAKENKEGDIVVVGSRIRRGTRDVSQQVQIIKPEDAERTGRTTLREMLQSNMVTGGGDQNISTLNLVLVDGGPGVANISLRRQGPGRTLVLLNGRRLAPAGVGGSVSSADLNTVPTAIIAQTQILKDGASSIYGSDAIAGVVDIITRKRVEGYELSSVVNVGEEAGGEMYRISTVGGYSTDRFNLTFGVDYNVSKELEFGDRKNYRCPTSYVIDITSKNPVPGSGDYIDPATGKPLCWGLDSGGVMHNFLATQARLPGVSGTNKPGLFTIWVPNPNITEGIAGMEGVNNSTVEGFFKTPFFDPDMLKSSIMGESKAVVAMASATYDLQALGDAELYLDLLGSERRYFHDFYEGEEYIYYVEGSPLIPEDWVIDPESYSDSNEITGDQNIMAKAKIFTGLKRSKNRVRFWRASGGIRGDMPLPGWRYDMTYTFSRSDAWEKMPARLTSRLSASMNVIKVDGKLVCADATARANGCVPIPKFSPDIFKKGGAPQAWLNYIYHDAVQKTLYTDNSFNLDFDGPLFDLPYGQVKGAFGAEARFASIDDRPDAQSIANNIFAQGTAALTKGKGNSLEAYGEVELPLLAEVPFAKVLSLNASARLTKGDSTKANINYKMGGLYTPLSWLSFRGSYGTSYRAPALFERFLGDTSGFVNGETVDPCVQWKTRHQPGSNIYNNCASEAVPGDFIPFDQLTVISRGSKAGKLEGEKSRNLSIGTVLQPELPSGWGNIQFSADYYNLRVKGGISRLPFNEIVNRCYEDRKFRNGGVWCPLVGKRDPKTYQLSSVSVEYLNLSSSQSRGLDFNFTYTRSIGIGDFGLSASLARVLTDKMRLFDTEPYDDTTGALGQPKMTGSVDMDYGYKRWSFGYSLDWVAATDNLPFYQQSEEYKESEGYRKSIASKVASTPDYFMHSASVSYSEETWHATFAVRNLLNKTPPRVSAGMADRLGDMLYYSGYDLFGRAYTLSLKKKF